MVKGNGYCLFFEKKRIILRLGKLNECKKFSKQFFIKIKKGRKWVVP